MRTAVMGIAAAILTFGAAGAQAQQCYTEDCGTTETEAGQSAATQSVAISEAIGNAVAARFGANKDLTTQDGGGAASTNTAYWISAAGRKYSGDTDGWQNEGVAGIDVYFSDSSLAGGFVGVGSSSRESLDWVDPTEITARVGGLYYAHQYADSTILHFYAGGGKADYNIDGASVDATRYMAGIDISKSIERANAAFVPFGKLVVSTDKVPEYNGNNGYHPSANIVGTTLTAGGRWEYKTPIGKTELLPYFSLGVDYLTVDPDNGNEVTTTWGPRVEAGFSGPVGSGLLALDLHAAKADAGTSDLGGALTYSFGF